MNWSSNNTAFFFQVMKPAFYLLLFAVIVDMFKLTPRHRE